MAAKTLRSVCVQALDRWEGSSDFADAILRESLASSNLSPLDRALLQELFYGVLRNLTRLDFIRSLLRKEAVDPLTLQILRIGFYQIFHTRIPSHAAVNETVELAGKSRPLVNALLRRCLRERDSIQRSISESSPSIQYSHPELLVSRWRKAFGDKAMRALCEWNNSPPEMFVRANGIRTTRDELLRKNEDAQACPFHTEALTVKRLPEAWLAEGLCYVQDPSTLMSCDLVAPQPGERVLDACASPGGKTTYMASLMKNQGEIIACDVSERLPRLSANLASLGVTNVRVVEQNWIARPSTLSPASFDRILVDAPCTNTGVIRRRVDARWRLRESDFQDMPRKQMAIVGAVSQLLKKGGILVYSTCSLEPEENELILGRLSPGDLTFVESKQLLPFRDGTDGAFAAKFVKK